MTSLRWQLLLERNRLVLVISLVGLAINFCVYIRLVHVCRPSPAGDTSLDVELHHQRLVEVIERSKVSTYFKQNEFLKSSLQSQPTYFLFAKQATPRTKGKLDVEQDIQSRQSSTQINTASSKSNCPDLPPDLLGPVSSNMANMVPEWLEQNYNRLKGGHYAPDNCISTQKVAVIIPFRNRHSHLYIMLNNLLPILIRQQTNFRLFVLEQTWSATFNRGLLLNVGFLEALKMDNFDCFIFHDVDLIPLNDRCLYRCDHQPRHLSAAISKWRYRLPYHSYFGGVVALTRKQFQDMNGCSNVYFGWGGEDDDMQARLATLGYQVLRYSKVIGRYFMIGHAPDEGNGPDPKRAKMVDKSRSSPRAEGLNTTVYRVTRIDVRTLYTWIRVDINMTDILQLGHNT